MKPLISFHPLSGFSVQTYNPTDMVWETSPLSDSEALKYWHEPGTADWTTQAFREMTRRERERQNPTQATRQA